VRSKSLRFLAIAVFVGVGLTFAAVLAGAGPSPSDGPEAPPATSGGQLEDGVVAYYFYGDVRCATCRKLEAYSNEAVTQGFPEEIDSGRLAWKAVNVDEKENAHFVDDFQLVTKAVVLVEYRAGTMERWENLDKIWTLVRNKDNFIDYVQSSTREFLQTN